MSLQVTAIMIGVKDLAHSKKFYGEGLGCLIDKDYPHFVSINLGEGSSSLDLSLPAMLAASLSRTHVNRRSPCQARSLK
jgi:extradiol dioxygenase family protein